MQVNARLVMATCLTVMATGAASGCSVFERDLDDGGFPVYTAEPETATLPAKAVSTDDDTDPAGPGGAAAGLVSSVSLTTKDVKKRGMGLKTDADDLDKPTLAGCDGEYASEEKRLARRRVLLTGGDTGDDLRMVSDVVVYDSQESAEAALEEWRAAWGDCPFGFRTEVLGVDDLRVTDRLGVSSSDLPVRDSLVEEVALTSSGGDEKAYTFTIAQRQGAVLTTVALASRAEVTEDQTDDVRALATTLGKHLVDKS